MIPLISQTPNSLNELKSLFLASLNHEIRTPLNGILGLTDLLLEADLKGDQIEYAQSLKVCAENLFNVLNATLEYSALSAGNAALEEAEFHIEELLRSAIDEYSAQTLAKNLTITFQCDESVPETAIGDAVRIRQVFCHLLSNGIKFTHAGKVEIFVSSSPAETSEEFRLKVQIRDSGIGIAQDRQKVVFEAFHQLETGLAREFSGLGLGLALTQKIIQLLDGCLSIESSPGFGSTFGFEVPVHFGCMKEAIREEAPLAAAAAAGAGGSYHFPSVLVVEDNQVAQRIVSKTLTKRNYRVVSALSGADAIDRVNSGPFDLILMDLQMPGMDGIEAALRIGKLDNGKQTPVVAFTANSTSEYREMCKQAGFKGFLAKPVNVADLVATVENFCGTAVRAGS